MGEQERRISPERVRDVFLGLNDRLVEILGAVSGFFAAFGNAATVLVAGLTVAFLSGMAVKRRILMNLAITAAAVVFTYLIGIVTKAVWGIAV